MSPSADTQALRCLPCNRSFSSKEALRQHLRSSPAHEFRCDICGKRCNSEEALKQHKQNAPSHTPLLKCDICSKSFRSDEALKQHVRNAPAHAPQPRPCDVCNRSFSSDEALKQHMRDAPAHNALPKCTICDRFFGSSEALQQHIGDSPAHAPSFQCNLCDKSFKSEEALQQHTQSAKGHQKQVKGNQTQAFFPELHPKVVEALSGSIGHIWFNHEESEDSIHSKQTFVMAKFKCDGCSINEWRSGKVTIVIRGYRRNGYNAEVFNQHCDSCNALGTMTLDEESYVDRVVYRLKVWAGVPVLRRFYQQKPMPPHKRELCEGCIQGWCEAGIRSSSPIRSSFS
ncbi:zinc-binding domain-containing protein [Xylaria telfairii]|nr:zinc-binding domain-containing protein [Xylaria telfairii]